MLVGDRLVPRVYAQARAPARSGLNPVIMVYFHSTFDLAMTPVLRAPLKVVCIIKVLMLSQAALTKSVLKSHRAPASLFAFGVDLDTFIRDVARSKSSNKPKEIYIDFWH